MLSRLGMASLEVTPATGLGHKEAADARAGAVRRGADEPRRRHVMSHARDGRRRKDGFANEIRHVKVDGGHQDPWLDVVCAGSATEL